MISSEKKASVDKALSVSLFSRAKKPAKNIDDLMNRTKIRKELNKKIFTQYIHKIFVVLHDQFSSKVKEKVKKIASEIVVKVDKINNDYYTKAEKLSKAYQNGEISYEVYTRENTLSLTNTYLAEARAYEDSIRKISELTGIVPEPSKSGRR